MTQQQWIQHLATAVDEASEVPLFGNPPEFSLELFCEQMRQKMHLSDLEMEVSRHEWTKEKDLLKRLDQNPSVMAFSLSPLESNLFWAMSQTDLEEFSTWTMSADQQQFHFQDPEIQKGYYHFLMIEALLTLRNSGIYPDLSPKLEQAQLVSEDCFTVDVVLKYQGKSVWGRLIVPRSFQLSMKRHFSGKLPSVRELKVNRKVMLTTELIAGTVSLAPHEVTALSEGDFLLLDHCTYHPQSKKGYMLMKMGDYPLAQMKVKEDQIKVLDYAYAIEGHTMDHEEPPLEEGFEEEHFHDEQPMDDGGALPPEENVMPEAPLEGEGLIPPEQTEGAPTEEAPLDAPQAPVEEAPQAEAPAEEVVTQAPEQQMLHPNQVPLTLSIEVAKLNISLEKLVELAPGNVLKTGVYPEQGVRLSLNGRVIGKGELLQVGDALGVKIIELAKE